MATLTAPASVAASATGIGDRQYIITFALGVLAGVVGAVLFEFLASWWRRPRLKILEDLPEPGINFSSHAVLVQNNGRSTAHNCMGLITVEGLDQERDILSEDDVPTIEELKLRRGKFHLEVDRVFLLQPGDYRPIRNELISWSRLGNPLTIDIYRGATVLLDVYFFVGKIEASDSCKERPAQLHIPSEDGWRAVRAALRLKNYQLRIVVGAENAWRVATKTFTVNVECPSSPMTPVRARRWRLRSPGPRTP